MNGFAWTWRCGLYGHRGHTGTEMVLHSTDQPEEYCRRHMESHVRHHLKCECTDVYLFKKEPCQIPDEPTQ